MAQAEHRISANQRHQAHQDQHTGKSADKLISYGCLHDYWPTFILYSGSPAETPSTLTTFTVSFTSLSGRNPIAPGVLDTICRTAAAELTILGAFDAAPTKSECMLCWMYSSSLIRQTVFKTAMRSG